MMFHICGLRCCAITTDRTYFVRGIVRDSVTNATIGYAAVSAPDSNFGTVADSHGIFEISLPDTAIVLRVQSQGYKPKYITVKKNNLNLYAIYLEQQPETLKEVVITRQKYSKRNNPAVDMMQKIRRTASKNNPKRNPFYNYNRYQRITLALNDIGSPSDPNALLRRFPFLWDHIDTSDVSGKPILNLSVKETTSNVHFRRSPAAERTIVTGQSSAGIDEIINQESMQKFLDDVLREIDVYDKDINLLQNRFVSPLSPLAADFYKFYIIDSTICDNGLKNYTLSFYPHNKTGFGFIGQMRVIPKDSAMFISSIDMRVSPEINLNFISSLNLHQDFVEAADGSRLKTKDDLTLEIKVLPGLQGLYLRRNIAYANHNFNKPDNDDEIFRYIAEQRVLPDANSQDESFWNEARLIELSIAESKVKLMMKRLRSYPLYRYMEKGIKVLFSGYVATGNPSKFDIGPVNTTLSYNSLEGPRLRAGGMTTAHLSPHWFTRFYAAYGFKDHKWKYSAEVEYSFNKKELHPREFPVHSIRLNSTYDIYRIGQNYLFTNPDNFILSLKRGSDDLIAYYLRNSLKYTLELENNFSFSATAMHENIYSSRLLEFKTVTGEKINRFGMSWLDIELRYAPGEKFYQTRSHRLPINMDAPVFQLSHRIGPSVFSSFNGIHRTELSFQKRFWLSAWGYIDLMSKGGHVWSKGAPYTQLFAPNANMSYIIQPESFALINPLEFVTDSYCWIDFTYWANGAILNYIPLIKKLKLREVFSGRSYWGTLSNANNPRKNEKMLSFPDNPWGDGSNGIATESVSHTPYIELSAGLDNIFKCLRIDYVWRITHRHPSYNISQSGLRLSLHITF